MNNVPKTVKHPNVRKTYPTWTYLIIRGIAILIAREINQLRNAPILKALSCGNDTTAISTFTIYRGATLAGTPTWTDIDANNSVVEVDPVQTYTSGGKILFRGIVGREGGDDFNLESLDLNVSPNEIITVTSSTEGNAALMVSSLVWQEDF